MTRAILSPEVTARWISHTERYEGHIPWMYLDIRGLVTIGAGALVDPVDLAVGLPLRHRSTGTLATPEAIRREWYALKGQPGLAHAGARAAGALATLALSDADLDALTWRRLDSTVAALVGRWPELPSWPWQAQLAVCSWAWAVGAMAPAEEWPKFTAALQAQDWATAAQECRIREEGNPGVAPRNRENKRLFEEAAADIGDSPSARLAMFMDRFVEAVHRYRSTREVWAREIPDHKLSSDPSLAEAIRRERKHRRDTELIPQLAPDLARQVREDFSRLYPDEREHIDEANLARAIEAFAQDQGGRPGRKRKGETSKHQALKVAFAEGAFIKKDTDIETAYRRAKSRRDTRVAQARKPPGQGDQGAGGDP